MTQLELLKAKEKAVFMTDKELDQAASFASVNGMGDLWDVYFEEHDRRLKLKGGK